MTDHDLPAHQRRELVLGDLADRPVIKLGGVLQGPRAQDVPDDRGPHERDDEFSFSRVG